LFQIAKLKSRGCAKKQTIHAQNVEKKHQQGTRFNHSTHQPAEKINARNCTPLEQKSTKPKMADQLLAQHHTPNIHRH